MPAATLTRTSEATPAVDAEVELLIREARRRAHRRRAALLAIAGAVVLTLATAFGALALRPAEQAEAPRESAAQAEDVAPAIVPMTETELVAAVYLHHMASMSGDVWIYLFDDGRLIRFGGDTWDQQRLTHQGVSMVLDMIAAFGIFDRPPQVRRPDHEGWGGLLQFRRDGELLALPHSWQSTGRVFEPGEFPERYRVTPAFDLVTEKLQTLSDWLPEDAWAEAEVAEYQPANYAICGWVAGGTDDWGPLDEFGGLVGLVPPSAAGILRTAEPLAPISTDTDRWFDEGLIPGRDQCQVLPAGEARTVSLALASAGWEGQLRPSTGGYFESDRAGSELAVWFLPLLPHGVPGMTPG